MPYLQLALQHRLPVGHFVYKARGFIACHMHRQRAENYQHRYYAAGYFMFSL